MKVFKFLFEISTLTFQKKFQNFFQNYLWYIWKYPKPNFAFPTPQKVTLITALTLNLTEILTSKDNLNCAIDVSLWNLEQWTIVNKV